HMVGLAPFVATLPTRDQSTLTPEKLARIEKNHSVYYQFQTGVLDMKSPDATLFVTRNLKALSDKDQLKLMSMLKYNDLSQELLETLVEKFINKTLPYVIEQCVIRLCYTSRNNRGA